jgi:hypothetical protein
VRKIQQQQILEILQTIKAAQSAGLYADCQEAALSVGAFIEGIEGADNPRIADTVALLTEYCELLYGAHRGGIGEKQLRKHLVRIENSIRNELAPNRIEVAFLSYNASMSDSIESIYLAAKADPDCDAFWIPIPCCERGTNGSLGVMRHEGADRYGGDIECTDWREYDIEARRPDAIFTFNPYDAGNLVTSVHPDFYCERLRNLTDMLVYVPYFVTSVDVPAHFCTVAGCVFAHRVVVQSEKVRDTYVRVFKNRYGDRLGRPEYKFVALGSPKYDKAVNSKREDCVLPRAWRDLIGDKKVVLYNTSIASLLAENERYLKKLRYVLDTFGNREDAVLWWRPHPLGEATYRSMRPQLLDAYKRTAEDYKREGTGIYDESPDLHRAIVWTDAYYGDGSSIVPMYGITGKPIMIQNTNVLCKDVREHSIAFENLFDDGKYLWFAAKDFNALFRMDRQTWKPEYMGSFPGLPVDSKQICGRLAHRGGKLYFAPFLCDSFYAYDLAGGNFEILPSPGCAENGSGHLMLYSVVPYKRCVFYTGYGFRGIVRYDTETGEMHCFDDWVRKMDALTGGREEPYFIYVCSVDNKLYCPCLSARAVLVFDMDTCAHDIIELNTKTAGYRSMAYDGTAFWLASAFDNKYLIQWDGENKNAAEYESPAKVYDGLWDVAYAGGNAWYLPFSSNVSLRAHGKGIDIADELCNIYQFKDALDQSPHNVIGDTIYLNKNRKTGNSLVSFNTATRELREEPIRLDDVQYVRMEPLLRRAFTDRDHCRHTWKDCVTEESPVFNLNAWFDRLVNLDESTEAHALRGKQTELFRQTTVNADGKSGQSIYDYVKRLVFGGRRSE